MNTSSESEKQSKCPICGHLNRPGSLVCANCSALLSPNPNPSPNPPIGTRNLRDATKQLGESQAQTIDSSDNVNTVRGADYQKGMTVKLVVDGSDDPMVLTPDKLTKPILMGRRDPITNQAPDLNLDDYAGYRLGVSRRHATIELRDGKLTVMDIGSANGTFINNRRIPMRQPQPLLEGDRLRLGNIDMKVQFSTAEVSQ